MANQRTTSSSPADDTTVGTTPPPSWPVDTIDQPTTAVPLAAAALAAYHAARQTLFAAVARATRARTARALARADLSSVRTQHARQRRIAGLAAPPGLGERTARAEAEAAALGEALPGLVRDHGHAVEAAEEEERAALLAVHCAEAGMAQAEWVLRGVLGGLMGCGWGAWEVQRVLCLSPGPEGEGQAQQQQQQQQQQQHGEELVLGEQQAAGEAPPRPTFQRWRQGRLSGDGQQHQAREALRQCFAHQVQQAAGEKAKARQAAEEEAARARRAAEEEAARARQAAEERAEVQRLRDAGLMRFVDGSIGKWWMAEDGDEDWTDDELFLGPSFRPRRAKA
ncbi:hypothetical protein C8A01DRAFT_41385 [Parachaetomium inaequale]|uniref:Uncharacterized protein n=1 Tax=Parachaetomium inaequale TaxID=2588326 RepID=A0AAN6P5K5_9PEZI|nr:hypothetical protein C8A01DRAFT_41385 [Parachaetomium inaequale]